MPWREVFMRRSHKAIFAGLVLSLTTSLAIVAPVHAQVAADATDAFSAAGQGSEGRQTGNNTLAQTSQTNAAGGNAPSLQGTTNGTLGPQGDNATFVTGVNTAGTVRVNNLANLEGLLNIIANGMEILGIAWGGPTMIFGFMNMAAGTQDAKKKVFMGCSGVTGGMAVPGLINWLTASARDANLFS
jgi:hypothetical protein